MHCRLLFLNDVLEPFAAAQGWFVKLLGTVYAQMTLLNQFDVFFRNVNSWNASSDGIVKLWLCSRVEDRQCSDTSLTRLEVPCPHLNLVKTFQITIGKALSGPGTAPEQSKVGAHVSLKSYWFGPVWHPSRKCTSSAPRNTYTCLR